MSHHCSLSASVSHMDDLSSGEDDRPHSQMDVWLSLSRSGSLAGTPRMKRRIHGSGHNLTPQAVKRRLAQQIEKSPKSAVNISSSKDISEAIVMTGLTAVPGGPSNLALQQRAISRISMKRAAAAQLDQDQQSEISSPMKTKRTWKNVHRWVEQRSDEPLVMIFLKWFLMIAGAVMVAAAVVIMCKVIHEGATGTLRKNRLLNTTQGLGLETTTSEDIVAASTITSNGENW